MSPLRISKYFASLLRVARISRHLHASNQFEPEAYRKLIPGLSDSPLKAYVHAIRHGVRHSAFLSRDPIAAWLLPEIISKRISGAEAKRIHADIEQGRPLRDAAAVTLADYDCTAAYLQADFAGCLKVLAQTSPHYRLKFCHLMLRGPFATKDIWPFMAPLHSYFDEGGWARDVDAHKIYRDLCVAEGQSLDKLAALTRQMSQLANRRPNASHFYLGFQETKSAPVTAKIEQSYGDYAAFQDAAARNAVLSDSFVALKRIKKKWEIVPAEDKTAIAISVPPPEVWVNTSHFAKTVRNSFKGLIKSIGNQATLIPVLFPYTRDISQMQLPCERLISYHSFAEGRDDILHYKESAFKGLCVFDRSGYSGAAGDASVLAKRKSLASAPSPSILSYRALHKKGQLSKYTQDVSPSAAAQTSSSETKKIILIALQVSDDSASRWHNMTPLDMVQSTCEAVLASDQEITFLIKPHPKDNFQHFLNSIQSLAKAHKNIKLTQDRLEVLLEQSDLVITANSGVGLEALLYGKPVITTGLSEYRSASYYAPTPERLKASIAEALDERSGEADFDWINNFFENHLWNGRTPLPSDHIITKFLNVL